MRNQITNYELIDFIRIELLLEQKDDYPDYMLNLFGLDWDEGELEAMIIYPKIRSKFESMEENKFDDFKEEVLYNSFIPFFAINAGFLMALFFLIVCAML